MTDQRLVEAWEQRDKLCTEAAKLWAEGIKQGNKLCTEGAGLWAEGNTLWAEAVLAVHGNIWLEWKNWHRESLSYECHLETGEIFVPGGANA